MKKFKDFINTFSGMITILTFFGFSTSVILIDKAVLNKYSTVIIILLIAVIAFLVFKYRKYSLVKLNNFSNKLNVGFDPLNIDYINGKFEDFLPTNRSLSQYFKIFLIEMKKWDAEACFTNFDLSISVQGCTPSYTMRFEAFSKSKQSKLSMDYVSDRDGLQGKPFRKIKSYESDYIWPARVKPFFKLYPNWRSIVSRVYAPIEHRKKEYLHVTIKDGYFLNNPECMDVELSYHRDDQDYSAVQKIGRDIVRNPEAMVVIYKTI